MFIVQFIDVPHPKSLPFEGRWAGVSLLGGVALQRVPSPQSRYSRDSSPQRGAFGAER